MKTKTETKRRRTTADVHRDKIEALIRATPRTLYQDVEFAEILGISKQRFIQIKRDMVEGGRILKLEVLMGPGGGTVYGLPEITNPCATEI